MNLDSRKTADADVILVGNSHAQMYTPVWQSIVESRGLNGVLVPLNGCLPTVTANINVGCNRSALANLDAIAKLTRAKTVIIGMTWWRKADALVDADGEVLDNLDNAALIQSLDDLIGRFEAMGKRVVLIGPIAQPLWDVASFLSRQRASGWPATDALSLPAAEFNRRFGAALAHFASKPGLGFARPDVVQCDASECHYLLDGHSLFADGTHLAVAELPRFKPEFERAFGP